MQSADRLATGLEITVRRGLWARLPRAALRRVAAEILSAEQLPPDAVVSLTVVGERAIQRLNRRFRDKDAPTDVLSFPLRTDGFAAPPGEPLQLGDVVLCYPIAVRQAEEYGHALDREVVYLFAHGMLHVLGYDHEREDERAVMRGKEERALDAAGLTR